MQTFQKSIHYLFKVALCLILVFGSAGAIAQQPVEEPPVPDEETPKPADEYPKPAEEAPAPAQQHNIRDDFSDEELTKFIKANEKIVHLQVESEKRMITAIEKEGLSIERFNEILVQQQSPDESQVKATPEELSSFNNAAQAIIDERQKTEQEMLSSVEQEGIDVETYEAIMIAYQQSPKVQAKVDKLVGNN